MNIHQTQLNAVLAVWTKDLNQKQESLVHEVAKINPAAKVSTSSLSRAKNGNAGISEGKLIRIVKAADQLLQSYGYHYDSIGEKYLFEDTDKAQDKIKQITHTTSAPLARLAGIYESYHIGKHGHNILKNIVYIYPNGEVKMHGIDNNQYFGQANIFQSSLLAINFHQANDYPFYIQILCHIGSYGKLASNELKHFFGICSSVSIDNEPIAYKRVFIRVGDLDNLQSQATHAESIPLDSTGFQLLNQTYPKLGDFLKESNLMISQHKVNEKFEAPQPPKGEIYNPNNLLPYQPSNL